VRGRLALLAAATTTLVLVAFLVPLALLARTVAADRAVNGAVQGAQSLTSIVATEERADIARTLDQVNASSAQRYSVFLGDGSTLGAPAPRGEAVRLAATGRSMSVTVPGGREILVAVEGAPSGTAVIRTYVTDARLRQGVTRAWLILLGLGLALVAVGMGVADRLARSMTGPIGELAAVSHRLARGELDARATPRGPGEVRDVAGALNHLAARIRELMREERESVADLSHRLRTPLTALRLESETLADPRESARMAAGVDAVERAVDDVIAASRRRAAAGASDAAAIVADRVRFWSVLAEDTGRTVTTELADGPLPVAVGADDLTACVDALLGNVFAHTPDGTGLAVRLTRPAGGGALLVVADGGPGFADGSGAVRRGVSGHGSTGLGLDIARRAARTSGGDLTLANAPTGGAEVTLRLGPPPAT
jgi:signal transduction histidine kinase